MLTPQKGDKQELSYGQMLLDKNFEASDLFHPYFL
jgi:hypothetical protein